MNYRVQERKNQHFLRCQQQKGSSYERIKHYAGNPVYITESTDPDMYKK